MSRAGAALDSPAAGAAAVPWLVRLAERWHPALVPTAVLATSIALYAWMHGRYDLSASAWASSRQYWGMALTYSLITAYLLACLPYQWRRSVATLQELHHDGVIEAPALDRLVLSRLSAAVTLAVGFVFGLSQYQDLLPLFTRRELTLPFGVMAAGNGLVWAVAFWVIVQRVQAAREASRLGRGARVDVYAPARLRPFTRLALVDVLVIMGALVLMPLQSLDFEFRWDNYRIGLLLALPTAALLLVLPLWGLHRALTHARDRRLLDVQAELDRADRSDLVRLELLTAHRERVRTLSTWPLDLGLVGRALFYLVIPPLAWVGAALVESLVDGLLN